MNDDINELKSLKDLLNMDMDLALNTYLKIFDKDKAIINIIKKVYKNKDILHFTYFITIDKNEGMNIIITDIFYN